MPVCLAVNEAADLFILHQRLLYSGHDFLYIQKFCFSKADKNQTTVAYCRLSSNK